MESAGKLPASQSATIYKTLHEVMQLGPFIGWEKGELNRLAERDIIGLDGMAQRPDLILYNQTETRVIDFKFAENRADAHVKQVEGYKSLLSTMGFTGLKGYVVYGLEAEVIRC